MHLFLLELSSVVKRVKTRGESLLTAQAEVKLSLFTCNSRVCEFYHDCKADRAWLSEQANFLLLYDKLSHTSLLHDR